MHALVLSHASWGIPDACRRARLEPVFVGDPAEARTHLDHAEPGEIACVLVDASAPGAHRFMEWLRSHPRLLSLPTLFLVEEATTDAFVEAHAAGADDAVVRTDATMIQRRIASLKGFRAKRPDVTQGRALVAISDSRERRLLGRYVRWAGFDPCFAETLEELLARGSERHFDLVVASADLGDARSAVETLRSERPDLAFVWTTRDEDEAALRESLAGLPRVAVTRRTAPIDHLLFHVNELMAASGTDGRDSRRLLVDTLCAYRPSGIRPAAVGLTYNLSRGGLYVRTLAPLPVDVEVWLELRPARALPWTHLRGVVRWRALPGSRRGATPPGFGVELLPELCPARDLGIYRDAYDARLARERRLDTPASSLPTSQPRDLR
ncbi:MAG TPA: hypothetical protein RMH85_32145 [Polyangiaceae bacterium LLY-WYZ-15_(1-7)]|nr:hypothetical protein [Myxococcales bacterium]HJL00621.1 hypothetical protein [Polyangiaceae bacterium LLY-WYZ-15_(1-7)]HJL13179.1 hypothetical protein [Polyangiaceae bacterium LLY-WYZ-15_(1-7)]